MATPTRTQTLDQRIVATVDTYLSRVPADVLFERNLLLGALWKSAKEPGQQGPKPVIAVPPGRVFRQKGREFWLPVANQRASTVQAFTYADLLPTYIDPTMTTQRHGAAYYTGYAGITWQEWFENSGSDGVIDLFQVQLDQLFRTMSETIETDMWSTNDGSSTNPKEILGIRHLIADASGTGTVWNINRTDESWQRNNFSDAAGDFNTSGLGLNEMRAMFTDCSGTAGLDKPSVIVTTPTLFNSYTQEAESIHRITAGREVDLGFEFAAYRGIPVTYSEACPSGKMYFLNLRYAALLMPAGADFIVKTPSDPNDQAIAMQRRVFWAGQWGFERYDRQGVIFGFTDA